MSAVSRIDAINMRVPGIGQKDPIAKWWLTYSKYFYIIVKQGVRLTGANAKRQLKRSQILINGKPHLST